jgi:predicted phosphodiesterase
MRIALLSDVHGNLPAFEAVLGAVDSETVEEIWCLGDLVGYGASPEACVELARSRCDLCLAGNHDLVVTGEIDIADFSSSAAAAAQWTKENIGAEALEFLSSLRPEQGGRDIGLFHASPRDPVWEYVLAPLAAELCLDATDFRVSCIGHSHVALSFYRGDGNPTTGTTRRDGEEVDLSAGEWLINPGSSGQPRDGDPRAAWLELDTGARTATWRRADYDIAGAQAAIRAARLPDSLAERLQYGQ